MRSIASCRILAVVAAFACAGKSSSEQAQPSTASARASAPYQITNPAAAALFAPVQPKIAPVRARIDSLAATLRRDSGTVRADSGFLNARRSLDAILQEVVITFFDEPFQVAVYPTGGAAYREEQDRRRQGLPIEPPDTARANALVLAFQAHGMWLRRAEGEIYFRISEATLLQSLGLLLTEPTREYLRLLAMEQSRPTADDASLMISLDELGDRVARTERFLVVYPDAAARDSVSARYFAYLRFYLRGSSNARVFDRRSSLLVAPVRSSYERYVAAHGATKSGELVRGYLDALRANNYRDGPAAVEYLRKNSGLSDHDLPRRQ